jgi:hypothetical protein
MIQAGGHTLCSETHEILNSFLNKEELPQQWKESIIAPIYTRDYKTVAIIDGYYCYQQHTRFHPIFLSQR